MPGPIAAVVVDHNAGPLLAECVRSLLTTGAERVVVVENGAPTAPATALASLTDRTPGRRRGRRAPGAEHRLRRRRQPRARPCWPAWRRRPSGCWSCNPDLRVHPGRSPSCAGRWRNGRPGPWWGRASSTRTAASTPRCASSPVWSTRRAMPSWPRSARRTASPGATTRVRPRGTTLDRGRVGLGLLLPGPPAGPRGTGRLRRGLLHVRRGHGPVLAGPPGRMGRRLRRRAPASPTSRG